MAQPRNYTRWTQGQDGELHADILATEMAIVANPDAGEVVLNGHRLCPDSARMIGVRLIDAAVLAQAGRAIRKAA